MDKMEAFDYDCILLDISLPMEMVPDPQELKANSRPMG